MTGVSYHKTRGGGGVVNHFHLKKKCIYIYKRVPGISLYSMHVGTAFYTETPTYVKQSLRRNDENTRLPPPTNKTTPPCSNFTKSPLHNQRHLPSQKPHLRARTRWLPRTRTGRSSPVPGGYISNHSYVAATIVVSPQPSLFVRRERASRWGGGGTGLTPPGRYRCLRC